MKHRAKLASVVVIILVFTTQNFVSQATGSQINNFQVFYNHKRDAIVVTAGAGSFIDLVRAINNDTLVKETAPGIYLVMRNLEIGKGVTLRIEGPAVAWVRLLSNENQSSRLTIQGFVEIVNSKLTSWNEVAQAPQTLSSPFSAPRAHILVDGGRLDIMGSEVSYLGYAYTRSYGISYYNSASSHTENSILAYDYRALYSVNSTNFLIAGNRVFGSYDYGLDPYTGSSAFVVENNTVYANGNHGIIISTQANGNIIRNNHVFNNSGHGIMLHNSANMNSVYNNLVASNGLEGVVVFNSSSNVIYSNTITGNKNGIRLSDLSSHNEFRNNTVDASRLNGIYVYDRSDNNVFSDNVVTNSGNVGLYIRNSTGNVFRGNTVSSSTSKDLLLVDAKVDIDSSNHFGTVLTHTLTNSTTTTSSLTTNSTNGVLFRVAGFGAIASLAVGLWLIQRRRSKRLKRDRPMPKTTI